MLVGGAIQGAVGFGANLFASPLLVLLDPAYVPGPLLISAMVFNGLMMRRDPGAHHWRQIRWPIAGLLPGSVAAAAIVASVSSRGLAIVFGLVILGAVGLSASGLHPPRNRGTLLVGGAASGFMGTAVGIGGPPVALLFQHATGPELRGALARFFEVSCLISIGLLIAVGRFGPADVVRGVWLLPGTITGYFVSGWLAPRIDAGHVRVAVLALSAASALIVLVRALAT